MAEIPRWHNHPIKRARGLWRMWREVCAMSDRELMAEIEFEKWKTRNG